MIVTAESSSGLWRVGRAFRMKPFTSGGVRRMLSSVSAAPRG
jgi:hypothetical protein